jgi:hypothetical protein
MYTMRILAAWKAMVQASTQCLGYMATKGLMNVGKEGGNIVSNCCPAESPESIQSSTSSKLRVLEDSLYWSCLKSEL